MGLNDMLSDEFLKFRGQRQNAKQRGIEWLLTFDEWMAIWNASGKYAQRGKKKGQYVMARRGDVGPYSKGNVFICTFEENIRDSYRNGHGGLGEGRGWTLVHRYRSRPYQVMIRKRYVGRFETQQEAEAAYRFEVEKILPKVDLPDQTTLMGDFES